MEHLNDEILERIEQLREKMTKVVREQGLASNDALQISQEIDTLLNKYNRKNEEK